MNREEALNYVLNLNEQERIDKLVELLAEKERVFDFVVKANDQKVKNEGPYVVMLVERESGIAYVPHFISKIQKVILIYLLMHPKGISFRAMLAHYDDISIVGHHHDSVFQRFPLCPAGHLGVSESDDSSPQPIGGSLKTKACACAGLEEKCSHYFAFQYFAVRVFLELFCHLDQIKKFLFRVVSNGNQTAIFHMTVEYAKVYLSPTKLYKIYLSCNNIILFCNFF